MRYQKSLFLAQNHATLSPYDKFTISLSNFKKNITKHIYDDIGYFF